MPLKLLPKLEKEFPEINFVIADPNENLKPIGKKLFIIDTVEGIDKVTVIDDLEKIKTSKAFSLHDFDLGFNLKLLQKMGELEEVVVIGLPMGTKNEAKIFKETVEMIKDKL